MSITLIFLHFDSLTRCHTPLHCAATRGQAEVASLLLDRGADIKITDKGFERCTAFLFELASISCFWKLGATRGSFSFQQLDSSPVRPSSNRIGISRARSCGCATAEESGTTVRIKTIKYLDCTRAGWRDCKEGSRISSSGDTQLSVGVGVYRLRDSGKKIN